MPKKTYIKNRQKLFIEPLEQRIMLDGAGASTFLDLIDERNQQFVKTKPNNTENTTETTNQDKEIPFINVATEKVRNDKKNIVFIDSAVEDYETITSSFKENTEFYLINANEDGFKRINEILKDRENIDALHLIGHGSAGQILFGNAFLNNETIDNYKSTLTSIGQSLTTSGDILFYGCNVASTEQGEILIKKISEITKADIAASDDLTGKDGDWDLEKEEGFINVKELKVRHYDHSLNSLSSHSGAGISHKDSNVTVITSSSSNRNLGLKSEGVGGLVDTGDGFGIALERQNISISSGTLISQVDVDSDYSLSKSTSGVSDSNAYLTGDSEQNASENMTVDSYLMFLGAKNTIFGTNTGGLNRRTSSNAGEVVFEGEIVGIFFDQARTRGQTVDGITYHNTSTYTYDFDESSPHTESNQYDADKGRIIEPGRFFGDDTSSTHSSGDWVSVGDYGSGTNNYLRFGADNNNVSTGDYIRILVKQATANTAPVADNETNSTNTSTTLTVIDGTDDVLTGDTDVDGDSLTVTGIRTGTEGGSGTSGSVGSSLTGTYGSLTIASDGTYTYVAGSSAGTDYFTYTVSDGNGGTDTAQITITVNAANLAGSATVEEDGSVSVSNGDSASSPDALTVDSGSTLSSTYGTPRKMVFSTDGTKLFVADSAFNRIITHNLATAYDISSVSSSTTGIALASNPHDILYGIAFNNDGTRMYTSDYPDATVYQWTLTTPWDVSTNQRSSSYDLDVGTDYGVIGPVDITFSEDGTKLYVLDIYEKLREISLNTAWDLSTASGTDVELDLSSTIGENTNSVRFSPNGKKFFIYQRSGKEIHEFSLGTAWDISSTLTYEGKSQLGAEINSFGEYGGFDFSRDGSKLFVVDNNAEDVTEYSLSTPFSVANVDQTNSAETITTVTSVRAGQSNGSGTAGSVNGTTNGTYGTLTMNSDGSYSYIADKTLTDTLDPGDIAYDYFTVNGDTDITITVIGINDTPSADNETNSTEVSTTLTVTDGTSDVLAGDTDADADASLTVSAIRTGSTEGAGTAGTIGSALTGSYGSLTMAADGTYTYVAGSSTGTDYFNYTVTDEFGATDDATLTITVNAANTVPTSSNATIYINENNQVSSAGDRTPSNITYTFSSSDFAFTDSDSGAAITHVKIITLPSSGNLSYSSTDLDEDDLEYEIAIGNIGNLVYTPTANSESDDSFTFKVSDGEDYSTSANTITVSVNAAPNVTDTTVSGTVAAGATTTSADIHDIVADSDDADSVLVVTGVAAGNESTNNTIITDATGVGSAVSGTYGSLTVAADGTYTYTASSTNSIAYGATATDTFTFTTRDDETNSGSYAYDVGTITFTVGSSISLTADTDTATEGTAITVTGAEDDVLNDDTADTDGLVVTNISHTNGNSESVTASTTYANGQSIAGTYGTLVIGADGSYTFTPNDVLGADETGNDVFTYTADGATATLTITTTGANDAPSATADTGYIQEGKTLTVADGASANDADSDGDNDSSTGDHTGDVLGNDSDDDTNDTLTITTYTHTSSAGQGGADTTPGSPASGTAGSSSVAGTYGTLDLEADGSYTYTANSDITGLDADGETFTDVFTYTLSDGTTTTTTNATITITIEASGDVTAQNDTGTVNEDATLTVSNDGNAASVSAASLSQSKSAYYENAPKFNNDGTKMFTLSAQEDEITEWTLTTAFDISTASEVDSFDISEQHTSATGFKFNSDGTKFYITGYNNSVIYEYDLSTAFDISTSSYNDNRLVISEDSQPLDFAFNNNGTKLFVVGSQFRKIVEYDLSNAFDITSASHTYSDKFSVVNETRNPKSITFNSDGTRMFVSGGNGGGYFDGNKVYEYKLTTGFDVTTASYYSNFDVGTSFSGITFNNDGTKMFSSYSNNLREYSVTSPFTLSDVSGVNTGDVIDTSSASNSDSDADGDTLTVTAIRTGSSEGSGTDGTVGAALTGTYGQLTINANGSYSYVADKAVADALDPGDIVTDAFNYTVSDGNGEDDIAVLTITVVGINDDPVAQNDTGTVNEDATLTVSNSGNATSVSAATYDSSPKDISSQEIEPSGLRFNNDGTKVFIVGDDGNDINEYALSTAFDISTATYTRNHDPSEENKPRDVAFNSDGTKMFIIGYDGVTIELHEYSLSTAYSLASVEWTTSVDLTSKLPLGSQDMLGYGIDFNTAGTKFFISGNTYDKIYEFTVSSGFDLTSTVAYDSALDISSESTAPQNIRFNSDGTKLFVVCNEGNDVNEYTLTTGFDISTATHKGSFSVNSQDGIPSGLAFNNDGTKMFVSGWDGQDINEYALTSPFNLIDVSGENTGDVIDTSSSSNSDSDADTDASLTVTAIRTGSSEGSGTDGTVGEALTGTYGQLTINANGSYTYVANQSAADALDAGDVVTDAFNYTVSDGAGTDIAVLTITVIGVNDAPVADDETNSVTVSTTTTVNDGTSDVLYGDTDADDSSSLTVTGIRTGTEAAGTGTSGTVGSSLSGTYGTLTIESDGTYTYVAGSSGGTDYFTYTVSDGTATDTAQITITVSNTRPTASTGTVYVNEDNQESSAGDRTPSANIVKTFAASDFNFSDSDGDSLSKIRISSLQSTGSLQYTTDGSTWNDVTQNLEISAANLASGYLRFTAAANTETDTSFGFFVHDGTDFSAAAYTMNIRVNSAPDVTDATVGTTVSAGTSSTGDVHDNVSDGDDAASVLVVTGVAAGNESTNNTIITDDTGVGSAVSGTYGTLTVASDGTYTYAASASNNIAYGQTASDTFTFTTRDDETNTDANYAYDIGTITFTVGSAVSLSADTDTVNEDATVNVADGDAEDVLENDTGPTSVTHIGIAVDSLSEITGSQSVTGTYGTLTMYATGAYSYVANQSSSDALTAGATANDVFYYQAGGTTTTLTITVTGIGPLAVNDTANVNEDATASGSAGLDGDGVLGNDDGNASYDTESLRVTRVSTDNFSTATTVDDDDNADTIDGTYGTLTIYKTGQYSYTPDNATAQALAQNASVSDTFYYEIKDDSDVNASTATLIFTITGQNDDPVANNDAVSATVGTNATGNVITSSDTDADGDTLTVSAITGGSVGSALTGTYGSLTLNSDGSYTYVVDSTNSNVISWGTGDAALTETFTYTVSDGNGGTATATITVSVSGQNDDPVADAETYTVSEDGTISTTDTAVGGSNNVLTGDTDADSDTLTVSAILVGTSGTPTSISSGSSQSVDGTYGTLVMYSNGTYSYTPNSTANALDSTDSDVTDTFTYTVSDGNGGTHTNTITITVTGANDAPVAVADTGYIQEGKTLTVADSGSSVSGTSTGSNSGDITDNDTDVDVETLTITYIQHSGDASASAVANVTYSDGSATDINGDYGTLTIGSDGSYQYVANSNITGLTDGGSNVTDVFTYTVSDGTTTDTETLTITIIPSNDPVADAETYTVSEDGTISTTDTAVGGSNNVLTGDTDADSDTLTVSAILVGTSGTPTSISSGSSQSVDGTYGTLVMYSNGTYSYTPNSTANALDSTDSDVTDTFTYTVSDGNGGTHTNTITITVTGANDAPVAVADTGYIQEGKTLTVADSGSSVSGTSTGSNSGDITDNDTDVDVETLTITYIQHSGDASASAVANVTYSDGSATDINGDYGTLTIGSDGSYQYVANSNITGLTDGGSNVTDVFTYTVSDGTTIDTETLTITIIPSNDPVANNDAVSATVGTNATGNVITSSDTDADGDTLTVSAITGGSVGSALTGTYGSLTLNSDGSYTYVVDSTNSNVISWGTGDAALTETFTYTVSDGNGGTATATITVSVSGQNDAPTASNNTVTITEDNNHTFAASEFGFSDVDGDSLDHVTIETLPSTGTLYLSGTAVTLGQEISSANISNLVFTPVANGNGSPYDSFTFSVNDGTADSASNYTMTVNVTAANDAPVAIADTDSTNLGTNISVADGAAKDVLMDDTDEEGNTLEVSAILAGTSGSATSVASGGSSTATGSYGTLTIYSNGAYSYAIDNSAFSSAAGGLTVNDVFTYTVTDGSDTDTTTLTISITNQNDAPTATADTATATEGSSSTVSNTGSGLLSNDTDNDPGDTLVIRNISHTNGNSDSVSSNTTYQTGTTIIGTYGTLTIGSDGTYTYTPNDTLGANETGSDVFTYTVTDGTDTDTSTLTFTVTGANDAPVATNDSNTIDISSDTSLTVTDGASKDIVGNDTDADSSATLTATEIRTGATEGSGTSGTIGQSLTGTYGSITLNANGSYTYNVTSGLSDTLDKGQIVYDYFNYTLSDGTATDYATIIIKLQNGNAVNDLRDKKAERLIRKEIKKSEAVVIEGGNIQVKSIFQGQTNRIEALKVENKTALSEGLKLVDLVAEADVSSSIDQSSNSGEKGDTLNLKFKVFNETNNDVVKYEGVMPDGGKLPEWIEIDPKTGRTITKIPTDVENLEFIIIATDQNNEKREIAIKIDPEQIKKDKEIFNNQNNNISTNVNESGTVSLIKKNNDGSIDKTSSKVLNFNNSTDITQIIENTESDFKYQLKSINLGDNLLIALPTELTGIFDRSKIVLPDGSEAPEWIKYDPITGEITATPPEDISKLDLKLIIDDEGKIIVRDLEIEFDQENIVEDDDNDPNKFIGFKDQLDREFSNWDEYGSQIINRL